MPAFEVIEHNGAGKPDAPSGTARELAELLAREREPLTDDPFQLIGPREARGAAIGGVPVHSIRLPGTSPRVEVVFGAPGQRLTIRQEELGDPAIFVAGTLLAARRIQSITGLDARARFPAVLSLLSQCCRTARLALWEPLAAWHGSSRRRP